MSGTGPDIVAAIAETVCEAERRRFEGGDKGALHRAILECAKAKMPLPDWCTEVLIGAAARPVSSWDAVYGKPHGKHRKVHAKLQEENWSWRVYVAVLSEQQGFNLEEAVRALQQGPAAIRELELRKRVDIAEKKKIPLEVAFARVATRFGFSESVCKKYYYIWDEARNKPPRLCEGGADVAGNAVTDFAK